MSSRRIRTIGALGLALCGALAAQQPNSAAAAAVWSGIDGPPWPVIVTATPAGGGVSFVVAGAPNQGFLLALAPAGVLTTGGLPTSVGLVDLDISSGLGFVLDGLFGNTHTGLEAFATTGPSGVVTWSIPFPSCGTVHFGALQVLVADPTSAFGFTATAATDFTVTSPVTSAVYVSATTGAAGAPGSQTMPVATISEGLALALASGFPFPQVRVAIGVYQEAPSFPQLACVIGGYDPVTWAPIPGMRSFVDVGQSTATAVGVLAPTVISGLEFSAPSAIAPNLSSIAFRVEGGTGLLRFENCRFVAHDGGSGAAGTPGQPGAAGAAGGNAVPFIFGTYLPGVGGPGMWPGGNGGGGESVGQPGAFGGGPGGPAGIWCAGAGGAGGGGPPGADGAPGAPAPAGVIQNGGWVPALGGTGTGGTHGLGGGGGGGGAQGGLAGSSCVGAAGGPGGGGGAGGDGGQPGSGGLGGGASIALLVIDGTVVLSGCEFASGVGGAGGTGGNGGAAGPGGGGGTGGPGSPGAIPGGHGGPGGPGGPGAGGGGGAGGDGGPSFGIYRFGSANPMLISPVFTSIAGGQGGAGGLHGTIGAASAPQGANGASGSIGP